MTHRHRIDLEDADIHTLLRAVQSHAAVLRQGADITRVGKGETSPFARENDRLSHTNSLLQFHERGCDCPTLISPGGS